MPASETTGARVVRWRPPTRTQIACIAAFGVALAVALTQRDPIVGVIAGSCLVVLVALPTAGRLRVDPLDGPGLYAAFSAVCFGVLSVTWIGSPPIAAPAVDRADIAEALLLVTLGLGAFGIGARLSGLATPREPLPASVGNAAPLWLILAVFATGIVGLVVGILLGAVGVAGDTGESAGVLAYAQFIQQASVLGAFVVLVLAITVLRRQEHGLPRLLIALAAVQMVAGFASGFKQQALLPMVFIVLAYITCRGRVPWRALIAMGAVFLLVLVPATIMYRYVLRPDPIRNPFSPGALAYQTWEYFGVRFRLIDHVALIRDRTPESFPYAGGSRYVLLPALVFVPRPLWPEKPILDDGLVFSHTYWEIPPETKTRTPLTQIGDLLRNFGIAGIAGGMLVWGMVIGGIARVCARRRSPRLDMVYIVAVPACIAYVESDLPQLIAGASKTLPVAAGVAWLLLPGHAGRSGYDLLRAIFFRPTSRQLARTGDR